MAFVPTTVESKSQNLWWNSGSDKAKERVAFVFTLGIARIIAVSCQPSGHYSTFRQGNPLEAHSTHLIRGFSRDFSSAAKVLGPNGTLDNTLKHFGAL